MDKSDLENLINNMPAVKSYLSRTWKERHANGTPVYMSLEEWRQCILNTPKIENAHPSRHEHTGRIDIWVEDWSNDADETVKFCNFRYKPEWIEKHKKQTI
jgi:hypothetical protein